jgi:hypothetical protein
MYNGVHTGKSANLLFSSTAPPNPEQVFYSNKTIAKINIIVSSSLFSPQRTQRTQRVKRIKRVKRKTFYTFSKKHSNSLYQKNK